MDEAALEELLSRPSPAVVAGLSRLEGDLAILGAGGKMGPSLARLARRALDEAGNPARVIAVSRFTEPGVPAALAGAGVETIAADLLDPGALEKLPSCPNLILMAGQKFGTAQDSARTWATNALLPGLVGYRFRKSRIAAFSTGNVYPLWPAGTPGPSETDPTGPVGEYAWSALARERVLEFSSRRYGTPLAILRLNYAIEPRYGVLRDLADRVVQGLPVDVSMGKVNVIWQRDASEVALCSLGRAAVPPLVVNLTGRAAHPVRWLAGELGRRLGREPVFQGEEQYTALLSDAGRMAELFGEPETSIETMLDRVAEWVQAGGRSLGKPTHFEERSGAF